MKTSTWSRTLEMAKMAARIGLKEARSGDLKSRIDQALILAESLSKLKGAAMKAGQLLSLDLLDYFPPEAAEILSQLQSSATAVDFSVIEQVLLAELGPERRAEFSSLAPAPVGTASVGQVHHGKLHGRDVAVKVQHPGVAESIDSDLKILRTVANSFCVMTGRQMNLDPLFSEFRAILTQEVDYLQEGRLQMEYRAHVQKLVPPSGITFTVPHVLSEFSTCRVLTMEWQQGETLRSWMRRARPMPARERLAHAFLTLYTNEFFKWGLVQTDPNPANFLIRERGDELDVVLLDFGATRIYSREFIHQYVSLLQAAAGGDRNQTREQAIAFGLIDPRESNDAFEALFQVLTVAIKPIVGMTTAFDFSDESHARRSHETSRELAARLKFSPPPRNLIFLHRKLGGLYALLKSLGVTLDVSSYWSQMIEKSGLRES